MTEGEVTRTCWICHGRTTMRLRRRARGKGTCFGPCTNCDATGKVTWKPCRVVFWFEIPELTADRVSTFFLGSSNQPSREP